MKWTKLKRFDEPYWFSGIYKISRYHWYNNSKVPAYYQVYQLCPSGQWGDYVDRSAQHNGMLTLAQCKRLAEEHAKANPPDKRKLAKAEKAMNHYMNREVAA